MRVWVCTWEPEHTLRRVEAIRLAAADGTIAALVKEHGDGTELHTALRAAKLVSMMHGKLSPVCPVCQALMDLLLPRDGIEDRLESVRDVVMDFAKAIDRTRSAKGAGAF